MKILCIILPIFAIITSIGIAGDNAGSFLDIKVGAKAMGMGGAFTAIANDGSAIYWNPAGLGFQNHINLFTSTMTTSFGKWQGLSEIQSHHYFLSVSFPIRNIGVFGFGLKNYSIGDIEIRSVNDQSWDKTGEYFDDQENALYFSYGKQLIENSLSIGIGVVAVQQKFSFDSEALALGFGINIGMIYHICEYMAIGFKVDDNITMKWKYGDNDTIPFKAKAGIALNLFKKHLILAADLEQRKELPLRLNCGFELLLLPQKLEISDAFSLKNLSVRGGINNQFIEQRDLSNKEFDNNINLTFGFGLHTKISKVSLLLDYSYEQAYLGNNNRISIAVQL